MRRVGGVTRWWGPLLVAALVLTSCSDDGEETAATGDVAPTSTAEVPSTTEAPTTSTTVGATTTTAPGSTTTTGATAPTSAPPGEQGCETVAFTPNSEDAASDVRATGLTCEEAEAFVRQAGAVTSSGGPEELDVAGYHCVRTATEDDPLPTSTYRCSMGSKQVTFVRS